MTQAMIQGSAEWHAHRATGIGGSDAAAVLGLSKYKTKYQLFLEKTGQAEPQDETWEMGRGKALEPLLRQHYSDTTGRVVMLPKTALRSEKYPFMLYNPDGLSDDGRLVEFKTASYGKEWGEVGSDEIPQEYLLQVQHGMVVTGLNVTDVTVSVAGNAPRYFVVEADKELQEMVIETEAAFWSDVQSGIAPEPTTNDDVAKMHRFVNGESIVATEEISIFLRELHFVRDKIKDCEIEKERLDVIIKNFMGSAEFLVNANGLPLATWKQQAGAKRINADKLRKSYPDVAADVTEQGEPQRRFLLK
jgi:putative phage-type endonuclease